ncbi:membrane protein [Marmoricola endophyticus]|uniref:Membrane protein n=1 Tax=Marmoricola endophyticus TaxID=2040280 RepID=A0A917BK16_9ACTN|nr:glycosyltransferase 87 family protein [Marmoricola endophyticus]GGF47124.1 membrane protein [Marmoricola endophyticus]
MAVSSATPADEPVAPTRADPLARDWSEGIGGPPGRHHRPHTWWTPLRVILALATVVAALSLVQKAPCVQTQWSDAGVRYSRMCYSDVPYLYTGRGLAERVWPYTDSAGEAARYPAMEYPVVISYVAWATALALEPVAPGPSEQVRAQTSVDGLFGLPGMAREVNAYFLLTAIVLLAAALGTTYLLAGVHRRRPWDALPFALSPVLLVTGLVNWDLLAVVAVAGALWAWARGRPVLTGVLIGLGTATKLYPLFLLGGVLVICLRRRDWPTLARVVAGAAASWLVLNLPALLSSADRWKVFWTFNSDRGPDLGSLWLAASLLGHPVSAQTLNLASGVLFVLGCLAVLVLGLRAPRTPRLAQLAFLVVAAFLLVNKVYSPQYVLWLLPLAVLARPRWRDLLIWQAGELVYFAAVWLYLDQTTASATTGAPDPLYLVAIAVRVLAEIYLVAVVVRDVLEPEHDPVAEERDAEPVVSTSSLAGARSASTT